MVSDTLYVWRYMTHNSYADICEILPWLVGKIQFFFKSIRTWREDFRSFFEDELYCKNVRILVRQSWGFLAARMEVLPVGIVAFIAMPFRWTGLHAYLSGLSPPHYVLGWKSSSSYASHPRLWHSFTLFKHAVTMSPQPPPPIITESYKRTPHNTTSK